MEEAGRERVKVAAKVCGHACKRHRPVVTGSLKAAGTDLQMEEAGRERAAKVSGYAGCGYAARAYAGSGYADDDCGRQRCNRHTQIGIDQGQRSSRDHGWTAAREAATAAAREAATTAAHEAAQEVAPAEAMEAELVAGAPESTCWSSCSSCRGPHSCSCHTPRVDHALSLQVGGPCWALSSKEGASLQGAEVTFRPGTACNTRPPH